MEYWIFNIAEKLLSAVALAVTLYFINKGTKKNPAIDFEGTIFLQLHPLYAYAAYLFIGIAILGYVDMLWSNNFEIWVAVLMLPLLLFGLFIYTKSKIAYIKANKFGIEGKTFYGKIEELCWHEIEYAHYNKMAESIEIKGNGKIIKAHSHLVGFSHLMKLIEEKTSLQIK